MAKQKEDRTTMLSRVATTTPDEIKHLAKLLGYIYHEEGSSGKLLDAIARREVLLEKIPEKDTKVIYVFPGMGILRM